MGKLRYVKTLDQVKKAQEANPEFLKSTVRSIRCVYETDPAIAKALVAQMPSIHVEHVGSTAVPDCEGKGIVDVALLYPPGMLRQTRDLVDALGFQRQQTPDPFPEERPMRVGAIAHTGHVFQLHVHILSADSEEVGELLSFRNRLRREPDLRQAYVDHKRAIIATGISDSLEYCYAKAGFIEDTLGKSSPPHGYPLNFTATL